MTKNGISLICKVFADQFYVVLNSLGFLYLDLHFLRVLDKDSCCYHTGRAWA